MYKRQFHILSADVQNTVYLRIEEGCGCIMGDGLHFALVQHQRGFDQRLAVACGAGIGDAGRVRHLLIDLLDSPDGGGPVSYTHLEESYRDVFRIIFFLITPVIFTTFVNNASAYLDSYLYSSIQGMHGIAADSISAAYGEFSNYYQPIINIPLAMASASASALMPEVSGCVAVGNYREANRQINQTIRLTMFICIPATVGLTVLASPIMGVLFPASTELAARLLMTGALSVIFTALATITGSVLQSIGRQKEALVNAGIALVLNLGILALLLGLFPALDIYAVMIASILFSVIYCLLNSLSMRKHLGYRNEMRQTYMEPLLASAGMGVVAALIYYGLFAVTRRPFICLVISIVVAVVVYLVLYVIVSRTSEEEMRRFPFGSKLVKMLRVLRVYR